MEHKYYICDMENKGTIPGDDALNQKMPDFMKGMDDLKKDISGLPEMLKKMQEQLGDKMKVIEQKEGLLNGKKVRVKLLGSGEAIIQWADLGEGKKFINSIK